MSLENFKKSMNGYYEMKNESEIYKLNQEIQKLKADREELEKEQVRHIELLQEEYGKVIKKLEEAVHVYERHVRHHLENPNEKPPVTLKYALKAKKEADTILDKTNIKSY
jgi:hypothetical protein